MFSARLVFIPACVHQTTVFWTGEKSRKLLHYETACEKLCLFFITQQV